MLAVCVNLSVTKGTAIEKEGELNCPLYAYTHKSERVVLGSLIGMMAKGKDVPDV